jgi:hypothetical protein
VAWAKPANKMLAVLAGLCIILIMPKAARTAGQAGVSLNAQSLKFARPLHDIQIWSNNFVFKYPVC